MASLKSPLPYSLCPHFQVVQRYARGVMPQNNGLAARLLPVNYYAVLHTAHRETIELAAFDRFPRFVASRFYTAMLASASTGLSDRVRETLQSLSPTVLFEKPGKAGTNTDIPRAPNANSTTWLSRFIRIADMMPICITLADVSWCWFFAVGVPVREMEDFVCRSGHRTWIPPCFRQFW